MLLQFPRFWKISTESKPAVTTVEPRDNLNVFRVGEEYELGEASSKISVYDTSYVGYQLVIQPKISFKQLYDYYLTIGKVQAVVDSYVSEVITREWEFGTEEDEEDDTGIEKAEDWADTINLKALIEYTVRDWLVCGNSMLGTTDWKNVQMDHVVGLKQDDYGNVQDYVVTFNGKWESLPLKPEQYIHSKFIDANRMPWGIGLFHALANTFIWNAKQSTPALELYRRHLQNVGQVEEKYAFPRVMYSVDGLGISKAEIEKLKEQLKGWKPGDRLFIDKVVQMLVETIDGARGGLLQTTTDIQDAEMDSGLQSNIGRLRTEPSAMADAREANTKDDAMLLHIMAKVEELINRQILPMVLGEDTEVRFHFGQQDDMEIDFNELMQIASAKIDNKPVVSPKEFRALLAQKGVTLDDTDYEAFVGELEQQKQDQMQQFQNGQAPASPNDNLGKDDDKDVKDLQKEAYRAIIKKANED